VEREKKGERESQRARGPTELFNAGRVSGEGEGEGERDERLTGMKRAREREKLGHQPRRSASLKSRRFPRPQTPTCTSTMSTSTGTAETPTRTDPPPGEHTENPFASTHSLDANPFDDPPPENKSRVDTLARRERDLERREQELNQRAEHIRRHGRNNWPPCLSSPRYPPSSAQYLPQSCR